MPSPEKLCPVTQQGLAERMGSAARDSGGVTHQWPVQNAGQQAIPAVQSGPTQLQGTSSGPCPTADSAHPNSDPCLTSGPDNRSLPRDTSGRPLKWTQQRSPPHHVHRKLICPELWPGSHRQELWWNLTLVPEHGGQGEMENRGEPLQTGRWKF